MELKATTLGKRLAQHPYDRAVILNAGIKVSGDRHEYLIPFNQLLAIHCKRGLVWGELEFISCGARLAVFDIAELREVTSYDELELDTLGDRKNGSVPHYE